MLRRLCLLGLAAIAAAGCSPQKGKKSGPLVASGNGIAVTADEFKARLDEQSPFIRARYSTLDRKKEFLDNLVRFEVLANEAEKQGLANDPDVQLTLKKVMVQKLVQKNFQDANGASQIPDAELQKYFDEHKDEYFRPRKVRLAAVAFAAPAGSADRAKKIAAAKKALAKLKADEKKNPLAFTGIVNEFSEDAASKATGGDLGYKSKDELGKAYSKELAEAAFNLKDGETSGVIETAQGVYLLKSNGHQEEMNRSFDQVKSQIANKLYREKKTKEFDAWLKRLRDDAHVTVDEKALDAVPVAAAPAMPAMGTPGMMGAMPVGHGMGAAPVPVPNAPAPATAPAPARK